MFKQLIPFMLMNLLDDPGAGDGGGSIDPDGGDPGVPGGDPGSGQGGAVVPEWLNGVDSNLAGDPSMGNIKDLQGLVKSFIHSQKLVGSDKMVIPNKNSTPEAWREALNNLGLPKDVAEYEVKAGEDTKLDESFQKAFVEKAFEEGILPKQAQNMLSFYEDMVSGAEEKHLESMKQIQEQGIADLKEEWGEGYKKNLAAANYAIDEFGGEALREHLKGIGLINDPMIAKIFSNIGLQMSEDEFATGNSNGFGLTPDQAQEKMNNMLADKDHPINNPHHANHKIAQKEYNKLAKMTIVKK